MRITKSINLKSSKNSILWIGIIFFCIGLLFLIITIGITILSNNSKKKAEQYGTQVDAKITDIQRHRRATTRRRSGNRYEYDVYVQYEYNEQTYDKEINWYSSDMSVGDVLQISIDKNNPENILSIGKIWIVAIIFGIVGAVFLFTGAYILWFHLRN